MRMPKTPSVYKQCVSHILSARSMEMYGSFRSIKQDLKQNKSGDFIQSHMEGTEATSKIRNLSQYVPAALAALLVPDG